MAGRGMIACHRCSEFIRKDKMIFVGQTAFCKHCRAVLVYKLRQLEEMAYLAD